MAGNVHALRPKVTDSEKITINLGFVDLGHIDLLVQEGFYTNRTDLIRTAIRNQIERHAAVVRQAVTRKSVDRSEEHTSELQSLMRISYAVFCLKKKSNDEATRVY